ncbi:ADP-ribosylation factor-like protein [Methanocella conradii]|uniref:ADP-ribosylation factor-like protein n=1 Tax=Methanocella conradii TaxID=1175444 RepID=UPI00157CC51A|nr:ADP-ribosylation factor-like protein [Methanocella conradii]
MDILLIVMAIEVIVIIVGIIGIVLARRELKNFLKNIWPSESIAVFGIKNVGKTTLIRLLKGETLPLKHVDTYGALPVGRVVYDLTGDETYFFRSREMYDVGGEHVGQWKVVIKKQNPDGIIYIVDTTDPKKEAEGFKRIYDIYQELAEEMFLSSIRLRGILVLINKADIWGTTKESREEMIKHYKNEVLRDTCELFRQNFGEIKIMFDWSSLVQGEHTAHNNDALRQFVTVLATTKKQNKRPLSLRSSL